MLRIKVLCLETSQKQGIGGDQKIPMEVKNGAKIIKSLYTCEKPTHSLQVDKIKQFILQKGLNCIRV